MASDEFKKAFEAINESANTMKEMTVEEAVQLMEGLAPCFAKRGTCKHCGREAIVSASHGLCKECQEEVLGEEIEVIR